MPLTPYLNSPAIYARVTYISVVTRVWLPVAVDVVMMQCPFGRVHLGCLWELTHLASGSRHYQMFECCSEIESVELLVCSSLSHVEAVPHSGLFFFFFFFFFFISFSLSRQANKIRRLCYGLPWQVGKFCISCRGCLSPSS